jgi:hypothetical protein
MTALLSQSQKRRISLYRGMRTPDRSLKNPTHSDACIIKRQI